MQPGVAFGAVSVEQRRAGGRYLDQLSAPIGLDIGALSASETALSILGEIIAVRRGREGGRLFAVKRRNHDVVPAEQPAAG